MVRGAIEFLGHPDNSPEALKKRYGTRVKGQDISEGTEGFGELLKLCCGEEFGYVRAPVELD